MATVYVCRSCEQVFADPKCPKNGCAGSQVDTLMMTEHEMDRILSFHMPSDIREQIKRDKERRFPVRGD